MSGAHRLMRLSSTQQPYSSSCGSCSSCSTRSDTSCQGRLPSSPSGAQHPNAYIASYAASLCVYCVYLRPANASHVITGRQDVTDKHWWHHHTSKRPVWHGHVYDALLCRLHACGCRNHLTAALASIKLQPYVCICISTLSRCGYTSKLTANQHADHFTVIHRLHTILLCCRSQLTATLACSSLHSYDEAAWSIGPAPQPQEVEWGALGVRTWELVLR
jgi:hypothetical protein